MTCRELLPAIAIPGLPPRRKTLATVRTEDAPPARIRVVLGWDHEVTRLGRENTARQESMRPNHDARCPEPPRC